MRYRSGDERADRPIPSQLSPRRSQAVTSPTSWSVPGTSERAPNDGPSPYRSEVAISGSSLNVCTAFPNACPANVRLSFRISRPRSRHVIRLMESSLMKADTARVVATLAPRASSLFDRRTRPRSNPRRHPLHGPRHGTTAPSGGHRRAGSTKSIKASCARGVQAVARQGDGG